HGIGRAPLPREGRSPYLVCERVHGVLRWAEIGSVVVLKRAGVIRDPEFSRKVNDIVIEFGNPLYQTVLDRFVDGDDVPYAELSKVWQMTTQRGNGVWDSPVFNRCPSRSNAG